MDSGRLVLTTGCPEIMRRMKLSNIVRVISIQQCLSVNNVINHEDQQSGTAHPPVLPHLMNFRLLAVILELDPERNATFAHHRVRRSTATDPLDTSDEPTVRFRVFDNRVLDVLNFTQG